MRMPKPNKKGWKNILWACTCSVCRNVSNRIEAYYRYPPLFSSLIKPHATAYRCTLQSPGFLNASEHSSSLELAAWRPIAVLWVLFVGDRSSKPENAFGVIAKIPSPRVPPLLIYIFIYIVGCRIHQPIFGIPDVRRPAPASHMCVDRSVWCVGRRIPNVGRPFGRHTSPDTQR